MTATIPKASRPLHRPHRPNVRKPFRFAVHQREDLPRAAMHDGCILSWDPGLGKTLGGLTLSLLKEAMRTLIVAPGALHAQWIEEAFKFFGIEIIPIPDQAAAYRLQREGILPFPGQAPDPHAPARWFITSYTALGYNGSDERAKEEPVKGMEFDLATHFTPAMRGAVQALLEVPTLSAFNKLRDSVIGTGKARRLIHSDGQLRASDSFTEDPSSITLWQACIAVDPRFPVGNADLAAQHITLPMIEAALLYAGVPARPGFDASRIGVGIEKNGIRCVMEPSLSTIIADCFDCAIVDEGVRLKSMDAFIAEGVLRLTPTYRYVLTGTPIKNRLPDIFALAAWVTGFNGTPSARWPYGNTTKDRAEFANEHMILEINETKAEETGRRFCKRTNRITNLHHLWKLLGPVVVRRRKDQLGEGIVKKIIKPIRIQPGTEQQRIYQWHALNKPKSKTPLAAMGKQLMLLRQAALCPNSTNLAPNRTQSAWTPKLASILGLAADLMEQGEQLVVFSPFQAFSQDLAGILTRAGVPCAVLDGNLAPAKRGKMAAEFKMGRYPVLIAGMQSMGEGHSFECCSHLVLPSLDWAYDIVAQAIERVHRLNSPKDVTIYLMVTQNSVDEQLTSVFEEKGDASDLALDGRLFDHTREEPDLAAFMRAVVSGFDPSAPTVDEDRIAKEGQEVLMPRLMRAAAPWRNLPALVTETVSRRRPKPRAEHSAPATPPAATPAPARPRPAAGLLSYADRIALLRAGAPAKTPDPMAGPALASTELPAVASSPAAKLLAYGQRINALRSNATKN